MAKRIFGKPSLDSLLAIRWWIPAAIAAALFITLQWVIPSIPASNTLLRLSAGIFKPFGMLIAAACGVITGLLYYKQRISKSSKTVRLLEPHFSLPSPTRTLKPPETDDQAPGELVINSGISASPTKADAWSLELLRRIESQQFEELTAAYFREETFRTETTRIGADEGIDIKLFSKGKTDLYAIVQCQACNSGKVGIKPVRELLGAMTHENVPRGIFVTTGEYTQDALDFAKQHPIILITGEMLINDIFSCSDDARTRLMNAATEDGLKVMNVAAREELSSMDVAADEPPNNPEPPIFEFQFVNDKQ